MLVCGMWPTLARLVQPLSLTEALPLASNLLSAPALSQSFAVLSASSGAHLWHCLLSPGHAHHPLLRYGLKPASRLQWATPPLF